MLKYFKYLLLLSLISFVSCKPDGKSKSNKSVNEKNQPIYELELNLEPGNLLLIYALELECDNKDDYKLDSIDMIRHDIIYQSTGRADRKVGIVITELGGGEYDIRFKDTYTHPLKLNKRSRVTDTRIPSEMPLCKEEHNPFLVVNYTRERDRHERLAYSKVIGYIEYEPTLDINFDAYFDRQSNLYNFYHTAQNVIDCGLAYEFE